MVTAKSEILTEQVIEEILRDVVDVFLIPHFLSLGMDASGEWRQELAVSGKDENITGRKYTEQLVYGRKPGTYAPIEPLKRWAMIKLGLDERQATSTAFAISKSLKEKGSRIYQNGGTDLIERLSRQDVIDYINERVGKFIVQQMKIIVTNGVKNALSY